MAIVNITNELDGSREQEEPDAHGHRIHELDRDKSEYEPRYDAWEGKECREAGIHGCQEVLRPLSYRECDVPQGRQIEDEADQEETQQYDIPEEQLFELETWRAILGHLLLANIWPRPKVECHIVLSCFRLTIAVDLYVNDAHCDIITVTVVIIYEIKEKYGQGNQNQADALKDCIEYEPSVWHDPRMLVLLVNQHILHLLMVLVGWFSVNHDDLSISPRYSRLLAHVIEILLRAHEARYIAIRLHRVRMTKILREARPWLVVLLPVQLALSVCGRNHTIGNLLLFSIGLLEGSHSALIVTCMVVLLYLPPRLSPVDATRIVHICIVDELGYVALVHLSFFCI